MSDVAVLIPVLARPARAALVAESLRESQVLSRCRPVFLCSPGDDEEIEAARAAASDEEVVVVDWPAGPGDYARKINLGLELTDEPFVFTGADDLRFERGWADEAIYIAYANSAGVVGTNDLGNALVVQGRHSTHSLVTREYALELGTIDEPGKILHDGYDHQYCNPPEAPVWMADLSFRALGELRIGDEVIGWERPSGNGLKKLRAARVIGVQEREAEIVRVTMESGRTFRCTPDHNWLNAAWSPSSRHPREWVTPRAGRALLHVIDPTTELRPEDARLAGWLGGIFDGEGSGAPNPQIAQSSAKNPIVYGRICEVLDYFGFSYKLDHDRVWLTGGRRAMTRFVNIAQPSRRQSLVDYVRRGARFGLRDDIATVEPDGFGPVISLTTSTGNYVAWGYASKNCDNELVATASARGRFAFAAKAVVEHLHPIWRKAETDSTYTRAQAGRTADARLFEVRRRLWENLA